MTSLAAAAHHQKGKNVQFVGLHEPSRAWRTKLTGRLGADS